MSTIQEDAPDLKAGSSETPADEAPARRRFAPRRSRSAALSTAASSTTEAAQPTASARDLSVPADPGAQEAGASSTIAPISSSFDEAAQDAPDYTTDETSSDMARVPEGAADAAAVVRMAATDELTRNTQDVAEPLQGQGTVAAYEPAATVSDSAVVEAVEPATLESTPPVLDAEDLPVPVALEPAPSRRRSRSRSKTATTSTTGSDQEGAVAGKATTASRPGRSRARQRAAALDVVVAPEPATVLPEDAIPSPVALEAAPAPLETEEAGAPADILEPISLETPATSTDEPISDRAPYEVAELPPVDLEAVAAVEPEVSVESAPPANEVATVIETPVDAAPAVPTRAPRNRRSRARGNQATTRQATNLEAWAWETESQGDTIPVAEVTQKPAATDTAIVADRDAESPAVDTAAVSANQPADEVDPIAWLGNLIHDDGPGESREAVATEPVQDAGTFRDWYDEMDLTPSAPGGDIASTEALAKALLELFPPETAPEPAETEVEGELEDYESDELQDALSDDLEQDESDEAIAAEAGNEEATEAGRRRGRRGRRGGRGRKRGANGTGLQDEMKSDAIGPEAQNDEDGTGSGAPEPPAPVRVEPVGDVFTPESGQRQDKPWRERTARRRWGKPFGIVNRDLAPVTMPPPKPSNGARFAPIPQAVQPRPFVSPMPDVAALAPVTQVALPRLDEPLAPGETRTERLLEAQTRLLQTMIEQQARQIELLTASVTNLHKAMEGVVNTGVSASVTTYQPRTGIFVDAPNVCYAAENARVNLDFGRMLKYLSRDRQLVHALSYSPIIDDVREGIRYETQRFVAPFLRTGYKLVTKPLKRFSDGSAKGNFDIELALDILTMAERLDIVVLVSGDSDFESVIEHIQSRGVRVEVVAFASNVSTELVNVADTFIDISLHLEHFKML